MFFYITYIYITQLYINNSVLQSAQYICIFTHIFRNKNNPYTVFNYPPARIYAGSEKLGIQTFAPVIPQIISIVKQNRVTDLTFYHLTLLVLLKVMQFDDSFRDNEQAWLLNNVQGLKISELHCCCSFRTG